MRKTSLLISFLVATAMPALAQTIFDPQTQQQLEQTVSRYISDLNKWDGDAAVGLIASNGLVVEPAGMWRNDGQQIQKSVEILKNLGIQFSTKQDEIQPIFGGKGALVTVPYTATFTKANIPPNDGNFLFLLEHSETTTPWRVLSLSAVALAPRK